MVAWMIFAYENGERFRQADRLQPDQSSSRLIRVGDIQLYPCAELEACCCASSEAIGLKRSGWHFNDHEWKQIELHELHILC